MRKRSTRFRRRRTYEVNQMPYQAASARSAVADSSIPQTFSAENKDATFVPGQPLAVHSSGVGLVRANATDNNKNAVGLAVFGASIGNSETVQTNGVFRLGNWTHVTGSEALAPLAAYFLDAAGGLLTITPPSVAGQVVQRVGVAVSGTELELNLEPPI